MKSVIAFDTSNYTTSLSIAVDGKIVENRKIPVRVEQGMRGVRQSDAVFSHTVNLADISRDLDGYSFDAVGVSDRPRDVDGSYMPCFLSGVACASVLSDALGIPLYRFSHQQGHVMAALYSAGRQELYNERIIAFHLSGGTTEMLLCEKGRILKIGGTLDISAGKLIDRTGVKLGFDFPCGPALERAAGGWNIPEVRLKKAGLNCNLSGCENKIDVMIGASADKGEIAAYAIACIKTAVRNMLEEAFAIYGRLPVLFAGGVSSNSALREYFGEEYGGIFPQPAFAADNAAGIALLASGSIL